MEWYESILKAMREVKRLMNDEDAREVYLIRGGYEEGYFLSKHAFDAEKIITKDYLERFSESNLQCYINNIKVIKYISKNEKDNYPLLYEKFKRSVLSKNLYRGIESVEVEYSIYFNIG